MSLKQNMKYFFTILASFIATNTPYSEPVQSLDYEPPLVTIALDATKQAIKINVEALSPDFSKIKIKHVRKYIESIYPYAAKTEKAYNIPAPVTIAIACLESGYGRSSIAKDKFNHLGLRTMKNGSPYYRQFKSTEECFSFYTNMFGKKRYKALKNVQGKEIETWVNALLDCGFNPREEYYHEVMQMVRFTKMDKIQFENLMI